MNYCITYLKTEEKQNPYWSEHTRHLEPMMITETRTVIEEFDEEGSWKKRIKYLLKEKSPFKAYEVVEVKFTLEVKEELREA